MNATRSDPPRAQIKIIPNSVIRPTSSMSATETDDRRGRVTTFGALCYEEEEEGNVRAAAAFKYGPIPNSQSAPKRRFGCIRMKSTRRVCLESGGEEELLTMILGQQLCIFAVFTDSNSWWVVGSSVAQRQCSYLWPLRQRVRSQAQSESESGSGRENGRADLCKFTILPTQLNLKS